MRLIVAVDKNWGIGYKGDLLFKFSQDMHRFVEVTKRYGTIVMGRKTFESFNKPEGLPGRVNWVLTKDPVSFKEKYPSDNVVAFKSIADIIHSYNELKDEDKTNKKDVVCIGGGQVYDLLLPYCDEAYVTKISKAAEKCDTYFPINMDKSDEWRCSSIGSSIRIDNGVNLCFWKYVRRGM